MDRRTFSKLSALSLAATQLPQAAPAQTRRIGFAPVGLGSIADVFMRSIQQVPNAHLTGFVTGHPEEKGKKFAAQYNVPASAIYTYETYNSIRDNKSIDAVYIALPNSMHCDYTVRAAEAGKHVFCEKPMAISSAECRRMIDACRAHNVKLMIGYRIHFDAVFLKVRDLIRSGALGELQSFTGASYGMTNKQQWRLERALAGGGSLFDLGIYPLNTIRWLTGEEPTEFRALLATRDRKRFTEVEQSITFLMKFPSGILAECGSSYGQSGTAYLKINGSAGTIAIEPAFHYGDVTYRYTGKTVNGPISGEGSVLNPDQFATETAYFADCILANKQPSVPGEEGLADLLAIEAIYQAAGKPVA